MLLSRLRLRTLIASLVVATSGTLLVCAAGAAQAVTASVPAPASNDDDEAGALIGDLVFHADLLTALDRLCPARVQAPADWHGALRTLLDQAFTPELRALSQQLGADAGAQLLLQRGGCHSRGFATAYAESSSEYRALLKRWRALGH